MQGDCAKLVFGEDEGGKSTTRRGNRPSGFQRAICVAASNWEQAYGKSFVLPIFHYCCGSELVKLLCIIKSPHRGPR